MPDSQTRKYKKLSPSEWFEVRSLWECGDTLLNDIAEKYGVSSRTLQCHFEKNGITKGSKAESVRVEVSQKIYDAHLEEPELLVERAKHIREQVLRTSSSINDLIEANIAIAIADPSQTAKLSSAMKTLSLASSALERSHAISLKALGLDKDTSVGRELTTVRLVDLTDKMIEDFQKGEDGTNLDDLASIDDYIEDNL